MRILGAVLRLYSYLFHLFASLSLFLPAAIAFAGGAHNLQFGLLPWKGAELTWWMFGLGVAGLAAVVLAVLGMLRLLFLIWSIAFVALIVRGIFFSSYVFDGRDSFYAGLGFLGGALVAVAGAWSRLRADLRRRG